MLTIIVNTSQYNLITGCSLYKVGAPCCPTVEAGWEHTWRNMWVRVLLRGLCSSLAGEQEFQLSNQNIPALTGTRTCDPLVDRHVCYPLLRFIIVLSIALPNRDSHYDLSSLMALISMTMASATRNRPTRHWQLVSIEGLRSTVIGCGLIGHSRC